jgi:hypothetical protein
MKYLQGTISMKITYCGSSKNHVLHSYYDANFAMDLNDQKFQSIDYLQVNVPTIIY